MTMRDNERAALDAAREACFENPGKPVGFLCGVFAMTMLADLSASGAEAAPRFADQPERLWRMSATPLPANREMRVEDWQLLDDALVHVGVPAGTKMEEHGAIRHWRWTVGTAYESSTVEVFPAGEKKHQYDVSSAFPDAMKNEDPDHE